MVLIHLKNYEQRRNLYKQLDSVVVKVTEDEDIKVTHRELLEH